MMRDNDIKRAYSIVADYKGKNNQINYYKILSNEDKLILHEFDVEYILRNHQYEILELNKIVKISSDLGSQLKEKYDIEFTPKVLKIIKIIGEMGQSYHCYAQYRQSVPPQLMYIPKKYILTALQDIDYKSLYINFDKYDELTESLNRKLKEHQKDAVRFMLSNKKCILADQQGLGKTTSAIVAALEGGFDKILVITTASLKSNWKKEALLYVKEDDIQVINGSQWDGSKKVTIANYDIIQNFYEVPLEPVYEEQVIYGTNGQKEVLRYPKMVKSKSNGKMVQKMQKTRRKDVIEKCLKNSPLFQTCFDCVIIDEVQKLSNNTSIRYKTISDFLKRADPPYVFLLSGTPLTNRPYNLYNILKLINADITKDYRYFVKRYCEGRELRLKDGREIITAQGASHLDELCEKIKHLYIRRLQSDIPGMVNKTIETKEFDLTPEQKKEYDKLWEEYVESQTQAGVTDSENYRQLVEGVLVRQYLAKEMTKHTIEDVDEFIEYGEKVIIFCTFKEEMEIFKKYYGKKCVMHNGEMTAKQKDNAVNEFMNNPKIKVFIGQIISASVGLTLTAANKMIFNSYSWVAADNQQAQDRIYRLTQTRDVTCQYNLFTDSISQDMFEKVMRKELIMKETIKSEDEKKS